MLREVLGGQVAACHRLRFELESGPLDPRQTAGVVSAQLEAPGLRVLGDRLAEVVRLPHRAGRGVGAPAGAVRVSDGLDSVAFQRRGADHRRVSGVQPPVEPPPQLRTGLLADALHAQHQRVGGARLRHPCESRAPRHPGAVLARQRDGTGEQRPYLLAPLGRRVGGRFQQVRQHRGQGGGLGRVDQPLLDLLLVVQGRRRRRRSEVHDDELVLMAGARRVPQPQEVVLLRRLRGRAGRFAGRGELQHDRAVRRLGALRTGVVDAPVDVQAQRLAVRRDRRRRVGMHQGGRQQRLGGQRPRPVHGDRGELLRHPAGLERVGQLGGDQAPALGPHLDPGRQVDRDDRGAAALLVLLQDDLGQRDAVGARVEAEVLAAQRDHAGGGAGVRGTEGDVQCGAHVSRCSRLG